MGFLTVVVMRPIDLDGNHYEPGDQIKITYELACELMQKGLSEWFQPEKAVLRIPEKR